MIELYIIFGAFVVLAFWAGVLAIGARLDRKSLEREHAERVFGGDING